MPRDNTRLLSQEAGRRRLETKRKLDIILDKVKKLTQQYETERRWGKVTVTLSFSDGYLKQLEVVQGESVVDLPDDELEE